MLHIPAGANPAPSREFLEPTGFLDFQAPSVQAFAHATVAGAATQREQAIRLYYAIRDEWRYDPFCITTKPADYVASNVMNMRGASWCVQKGVLMAACSRAVGIPAGVGLSDVTNHLTTEKLKARMGGSTLFVDHGYAVLYLEGKWVKAAPVFNLSLCQRFGVLPTEFDGVHDAVFQEYDANNRRHMEYLADHGMWSDLPLAKVVDDLRKHYPPENYGEGAAAEEKFEEGKRIY